jgi:hypothetical protein
MITITYKTSMAGNTFDFDTHTTQAINYEHAIAIAYDLEHGDFGELICFDIQISEPVLETIDDLPF